MLAQEGRTSEPDRPKRAGSRVVLAGGPTVCAAEEAPRPEQISLHADSFLRLAESYRGPAQRLGLLPGSACGEESHLAGVPAGRAPRFTVAARSDAVSKRTETALRRLAPFAWPAALARAEELLGGPVLVTLTPPACSGCPEGAKVEPLPRTFSLSALVSNDASVFTGRKRARLRGEVESLFRHGDAFSSGFVTSLEEGQAWFGFGEYKTPVFGSNFKVGYDFFRSRIRPGTDFLRDIDFIIRGQTDSLFLELPTFERGSLETSVTVDLTRDEFNLKRTTTPPVYDVNWSVGSEWSNDVDYGKRISTNLTFGGRVGVDIFDATDPMDVKASTSQLDPRFWMASVGAEIDWHMAGKWHFMATGYAQQTNKPVSQQCEYGGTDIGRGYDPLEASGDDCVIGLIEIFRDQKDVPEWFLEVGPFLAVDYGFLKLKPGAGAGLQAGAGSVERSSVSVGVRGTWGDKLDTDLLVGFPIQSSGLPEGFADDTRLIFSVAMEF
ncbi:ShlB/FhaC/HecB family hemolysin secretion/activation protein [Parvularcula sp. ZS-1/3]|uniref:ShlB/FhaC/HecB family hemolysin secretion/activation protein n=1 Tax=Parvularcula mediterranea TaxID=2732508 RepID=A0A7Y3RJ97_9PROT|nr:ShlB/FhaC/HecB family hemolysin secretion/activation protein [Parvularcula mediterranea]NNU15103.1 ShlB/FhaC/HecB family hemolysin secretion/activation protein [Parvularcula mediterranea]